MLRSPPLPEPRRGHTLAVGLEGPSHCNRESALLVNSAYSVHPGAYHQNGYGLFSPQNQQITTDTELFNPVFSVIQRQIQKFTFHVIKLRFGDSNWKDMELVKLVKFLDGKLLEKATSVENYRDLATLIPRLNNLLDFYGGAASAPPVPSLPAGSVGLGTTAFPEAYNILTTNEAGIACGPYGAYNLSNADGSYSQAISGEQVPAEQLQCSINSSYYGHCNAVSLDKFSLSDGLQFSPATDDLSTQRAFSDDKASVNILPQTVLSNYTLTELGITQDYSDQFLSVVRSNKTPDNANAPFSPVSGDISSNLNCSSPMLLDSHGGCGNLNCKNLSTLATNGSGDLQKSIPAASQTYHQIGLQKQNLSEGNQLLERSNLRSMDKMLVDGQQTQSDNNNSTMDLPTDKLECTYGPQQSQAKTLPNMRLKSSTVQPSEVSASSKAGYGISHTSNGFGTLEKSLDCNNERPASFVSGSATANSTLDYQEIPRKRLKLDQSWPSKMDPPGNDMVCHGTKSSSFTSSASLEINGDSNFLSSTIAVPGFGVKHYSSSSQGSSGTFSEVKSVLLGSVETRRPDVLYGERSGQLCEEGGLAQHKIDEAKTDLQLTEPIEVRKAKLQGVSLIEWFTASQVRQHLKSFCHLRDEGMPNSEKCKENICQICGLSNLYFDPPTIYCSACLNRIGRSRAYYVETCGEALASAGQNFFCNTCYKGSHGGSIQYGKFSISKSMLEKKKNDDRDQESWVQCDKCSEWQHQICTLFNYKKNDSERAEYICPTCYLEEMESGERQPLPSHTLLGAKDLPKSKLSEHIEKRLFLRLEQEQEERAKMLGKHFSEVPEAKNLVVRVVSSVDKKLEVQKSFYEIFEEQNYPNEFLYKSKVILLFQNIEGSDVCLFGMYVQEYGSTCASPNQRHIYISYIDSVKYFQPDIKASSGEALRTLVYHEILISYLDYSKKRGFASCYIWVCPATKREDFIFNCHPEKQKMPKKDKLREWYIAMLEKATKEDIVVHRTNLYDKFFISTECKTVITAARLPYFEGDYWPGIAEKVLDSLREQEEGKESNRKGKIGISRRALKAVRHGTSVQKPKDILLMNKLEELILPKKEDFILLQLQHSCNRCCQLIKNGKRWVCNVCRKFQLCKECHELEHELDEKNRHPIESAEKHSFELVDVIDSPEDLIDDDDNENIQSEIFDSRIAFLGLCQGEHYQYDSLRHAKYSTMMILYLIHDAAQPPVVPCANCLCDIKSGEGWHCDTCAGYDICDSCYLRDGRNHGHKLISNASVADDHGADQNRFSTHRPTSLGKNLLNILVHASACSSSPCSYRFCHQFKIFFRHTLHCKIHLKGGCIRCKKIWSILRLHAITCNDQSCRVPRCLDIRNHIRKSRKSKLRSDSPEGGVSLEETAS